MGEQHNDETPLSAGLSVGYKETLITDAHSTWNLSELSARQFINDHNGVLRWFAHVNTSQELVFR